MATGQKINCEIHFPLPAHLQKKKEKSMINDILSGRGGVFPPTALLI